MDTYKLENDEELRAMGRKAGRKRMFIDFWKWGKV
jgi:hypothetical protein